MAIQNQPGMFSLGAVELDSNPSVNLYAQLLARKQAKEDAIDEYYKKLPGTLNSAGMRDQSIPGFNQALGEYQKYWMENKDRIRKGNTPEAFNAEKMIREIQQKVNEDKNAAKTDLELGKMRFNKESGYIFDDPDFIKTQQAHSLPVWDSNYKPIDLGTITIPPPPFDTKSKDAMWKSITTDIDPGKNYDYSKKYTNPQTGQVIVPFAKTFKPEQISQIADRAAALVKDDKSARAHYNKILNEPTSETFDKLQKAYSKHFKGIVDTPEKAAAAEAIIRAETPQEIGEEQEINYSQRQADRIQTIILRDNLSDGNRSSGTVGQIDLTGYKDAPGGGKDITDLMRGVKVTGLPNGSSLLAETVYYNPATQMVTYKEYTDKKDAKPKTVTLTKFTQDIKTLNPQLDMKFLEGLRTPIVGPSQPNTRPPGMVDKTRPKASYIYNGKKYTKDQLDKAAKQSGMSLDEYIKKFGIK